MRRIGLEKLLLEPGINGVREQHGSADLKGKGGRRQSQKEAPHGGVTGLLRFRFGGTS
jgi:hypothetical protein